MEIIKNNMNLSSGKVKKEVNISNEEDVIVKDTYPDILSVLDTYGTIEKAEVNFEGNKARVNGKILCEIIYVADDNEKSIHSIYQTLDYEDVIDFKQYEDNINDNVTLEVKIDYLNVNVVNSRKFNIKYIINVEVELEELQEVNAVVDVKNNNTDTNASISNNSNENNNNNLYKKVKTLNVHKLKDSIRQKVLLNERYQISSAKPEIEEILKVNANVGDVDFDVIDGEVVMHANVSIGILYNSIDSKLTYTTFNLTLKEVIDDINDLLDDYDYSLKICEKNIKLLKDNEDENRVLDIEMVLELILNTYEEVKEQILSDVYDSQKDFEIEKNKIKNINQICRNDNTYNLREILNVDIKDIMQVVDTTAQVKVNNVEVLNGTTKIIGEVSGKVLFVVASDDKPLQTLNFDFPFTQLVDTKGTNENSPNNIYEIKAEIKNINSNLLNPEELELRFNIKFDLRVLNQIEEMIITNLTVLDTQKEKNNKGNFKIHIAPKDEEVWDILKKYNVNLEDIKLGNSEGEITTDTIVYKNQKVLIL